MKLPVAVKLALSLSFPFASSCDAFVVVNRSISRSISRSANWNVSRGASRSISGNSISAASTCNANRALRMSNGDDNDIDIEDEDYDPLEDGVDSVSWLPSLNEPSSSALSSSVSSASLEEGDEVLPFFPLGGIVYTPNSEHVLNIFEPRYRQMYNDILMNGSKRFVVSMSHPNQDATFATTGVIFHLEDLKEVSELTDDQVKYICNHKVTNRVHLKRVINPQAWTTRDTYLKVQGSILYEDELTGDQLAQQPAFDDDGDNSNDDEDKDKNKNKDGNDQNVKKDIYTTLLDAVKPSSSPSTSNKRKYTPQEMILIASFQNLVDKQHEAEEDVRFTKTSTDSLAVAPGSGEDGLWQTVRLWQSFIDQRLVARQNEMQREFQEKLLEFLKKDKGISEKELPSAIGFNDLTPALQQEVQDLQKRMNVELQPLVLESTLTIQKILEAKDHKARCLLLKHFIDAEKMRLNAKSTLQGMFAGNASAVTQQESDGQTLTTQSQIDDDNNDDDDDMDTPDNVDSSTAEKDSSTSTSSQQGALFFDEPDAFQ